MSAASGQASVTTPLRWPIRVLLAESDSASRAALLALLNADAQIEVVGHAADCVQAARLASRLKPDIVAMGLHSGRVDALEATRSIMRESPTPVVLLLSDGGLESRRLTLAGMEAGALAAVANPFAGTDAPQGVPELLRTLKSMARVKVIRRWAPERLQPVSAAGLAPRPALPRPEVVAIGASTGGPQVLQAILTRLPANFTPPVLVVQHIAAGFDSSLVEWLRPQCALPIAVAVTGVPLTSPGIYMGPTGRHLAVSGRVLLLKDDPPVSGHRPSATVLFRSVAREYEAAAIGVLLTGMGEDGASGLVDLKHAGAVTIAQDEASSVVFGMPAVAIGRGVVDHVLTPDQIPTLLLDLAGHARGA